SHVRPPRGCAIVLTEWKSRGPTEPNWVAATGNMEAQKLARYNEKIAELRKTDPQIDWSDVKILRTAWSFGFRRSTATEQIQPLQCADVHRCPPREFAERILWNIDPTADRPHSPLMLAARITLPHFSVSSAMNLPNSAGIIGIGTPPRSARLAFILGSLR